MKKIILVAIVFFLSSSLIAQTDGRFGRHWVVNTSIPVRDYRPTRQAIIGELLNRAKKGEHDAQFQLAYYLFDKSVDVECVSAQGNNLPTLDQWYINTNGKTSENSNYTHAIYWLIKSMEGGYLDAAYFIGECLFFGYGVKQNYELAAEYYKVVAEKNYPLGTYSMAMCYKNGFGVKQDYQLALKYFINCANFKVNRRHFSNVLYLKKGIRPRAQLMIGDIYYNGQGIEQNLSEAFSWYKLAAKGNNPKAQNKLGDCYATGKGTTQDPKKAIKWYRKAANLLNPEAQFSLGFCYAEGKGVSRSNNEAYFWYSAAAAYGNLKAKTELDTLALKLSDKQIKKTQEKVDKFKKKPFKAPLPPFFHV